MVDDDVVRVVRVRVRVPVPGGRPNRHKEKQQPTSSANCCTNKVLFTELDDPFIVVAYILCELCATMCVEPCSLSHTPPL